jgi:hypothetical protein
VQDSHSSKSSDILQPAFNASIEDLKEHFSPGKNLRPKRRIARRPSQSSFRSVGSAGDEQFHTSANTPVSHIAKSPGRKKRYQIKTDQIVESLVWFSFHIPRTVLEDLIAHELELWKLDKRRSGRRKGNFLPMNLSKYSLDSHLSDEASVSSLSDDGNSVDVFGTSFSEKLIHANKRSDMIRLPKAVKRKSAILCKSDCRHAACDIVTTLVLSCSHRLFLKSC